MASLFNSCLALSTSKHPQTDGQTEVLNQHLETMLRVYVQADQKDWAEWLDMLQLMYNNSTHSSHKSAPAELLLGYRPCTLLDFLSESGLNTVDRHPDLQSHLKELQAHRNAARDAIQMHALELVDVKGKSRKLVQRKIGPFEITEVLSPTTYRLQLPDTYPMHNVVNLQHLTKYHRSPDDSRPRLANPRDILQSSEEYKVEHIISEQRRKGKTFYLV